jgi:anaerobic selenocysteine-containing dehydrogenase
VTRVVRSACPLNCYDTCSWLIRVKNDVVLEVEGDKNDPYTNGFLCPKARYQLERHRSPDRPLYPMVREGESWKRASWDYALDLLAEKIQDSIGHWGPKSVFYYYDAGSMALTKSLGLRLFRLLGPVTEPKGSLCWAAGIRAQQFDFGTNLAHAPEDILNSRLIIIWGRNPVVTNIHLIPFIIEAKKRGALVTVIDPINSETAKLAHRVYNPKPGTDGALALAMANVLARKGLIDIPFVAAYTHGFDLLLDHIRQYTPTWAETQTGITSSSIEELACLYGTTKPGAILMGYGLQRYVGGGQAIRAINALAALTGNVGAKGGGANYANCYVSNNLDSLVPEYSKHTPPRFISRTHLSQVGRFSSPPVKVMVTATANPINQAPDAKKVLFSLKKIPFKATLDLRWSETAEISDLFLPVASPFEDSDLHFCSWHSRVTYSLPAVAPRGEARPDRVIWQELGCRLGLGHSMDKQLSDWIDLALRPFHVYGITAKSLKGKTVTFPAPAIPYKDGRFQTPSGKFQFHSNEAATETGFPLPTYVPPTEGPKDSLRLLTLRTNNHLHSQFADKVSPSDGIPKVKINTETLENLKMQEGEIVTIESRDSRILARLVSTENVLDNTLVMYEGDSVLSKRGVNLLTSAIDTDMGNGAAYYECFVKIHRGIKA